MIILQLRTYHANHTSSRVIIDDKQKGAILEDPGRPAGWKIAGKTCIPEGIYKAKWTNSPKFGRMTIQLHNMPDLSCTSEGITFTGIRVHGGVTVDHTEGCPLYGASVSIDGKLTKGDIEALEDLVQQADKRGEIVWWVIGREIP